MCDIYSVSIKLAMSVQWRLHSADTFLLLWKTSNIKAPALPFFSSLLIHILHPCWEQRSRTVYQNLLQHLPFHMSALLLFILQISHCYKGLCQQGEESCCQITQRVKVQQGKDKNIIIWSVLYIIPTQSFQNKVEKSTIHNDSWRHFNNMSYDIYFPLG